MFTRHRQIHAAGKNPAAEKKKPAGFFAGAPLPFEF